MICLFWLHHLQLLFLFRHSSVGSFPLSLSHSLSLSLLRSRTLFACLCRGKTVAERAVSCERVVATQIRLESESESSLSLFSGSRCDACNSNTPNPAAQVIEVISISDLWLLLPSLSLCLPSSSLHSERSSLSILSPVFLSQVNKLFERSANIYFSLVAKKLVSSSSRSPILSNFDSFFLSLSHSLTLKYCFWFCCLGQRMCTLIVPGFAPAQEKGSQKGISESGESEESGDQS